MIYENTENQKMILSWSIEINMSQRLSNFQWYGVNVQRSISFLKLSSGMFGHATNELAQFNIQ